MFLIKKINVKKHKKKQYSFQNQYLDVKIEQLDKNKN